MMPIWIPGGEEASRGKKILKATWKVKILYAGHTKFLVVMSFLCAYARMYNKNVVLIPTVIDTNKNKNNQKVPIQGRNVVVGWTGSHTTLHNRRRLKTYSRAKKGNGF
jgi:predicted nucleic-acid-binding Zn-ribbon protein